MPTFKSIVCPVDFSTSSRHALSVAVELAKSSGSSLMLVHAWHAPSFGMADAVISGDVIQVMVDDAQRTLLDWEAGVKANGIAGVTSKFTTGVPWTDIVRVAEESHADLIVMGTHGRTGLKHALIGSVAEKVVQHATCSVLVAR